MTPSIIHTKLYRPTEAVDLVRRTRLHERLNQGLGRPLTLVSGPAGYDIDSVLFEEAISAREMSDYRRYRLSRTEKICRYCGSTRDPRPPSSRKKNERGRADRSRPPVSSAEVMPSGRHYKRLELA